MEMACARPDWSGRTRSICEGSPVTTMREPSPRRVSTIFICRMVEFCASSTMTKALESVRPRMKAKGATSMVRRSRRILRSFSLICERNASQIGCR